MRDDILAKRMFLAGCCGLPWLWAVHSLYWYRKQRHIADDDHQDALLASSSDTEGSADGGDNAGVDGADNLSPEEVKRIAQKWARKCTVGSTVAFSLWAVWIILFHVFQDSFPSSWFVRPEDDADLTGW